MSKTRQKILVLQEGEAVRYMQGEYVILKILDLNQVLARNLDTGKSEVLRIWELNPAESDEAEEDKSGPETELSEVSDKDWEYAKRCLDIIKPLLKRRRKGEALYQQISEQHGISVTTLYRWVRYYRYTGLLSSLLPVKRLGGKGKSRLPDEVDSVIEHVVKTHFLTDQQNSVADTALEVRRLCNQAGLRLPHENTVRKRITWISERERVSHRQGKRAAIDRFEPNEGTVPDADWPLAMVQIDHTKMDVIIVHEVTRQPIRRPWITLAIDIFSRMILGMYISLDGPSAMSAGMCISHSILPKERWLKEELGMEDLEWPCWGVMGIIHLDNAREFRCDMLKIACSQYDIDLMLRPVKKPHYGAHIERLMGTLARELKKLPGATFSNIKERGEYDSEGKAVMTMRELEEWLTLFVAKYHHRIHGGIGMSPLQKYTEGLLGGNGRPPRGLPSRRVDEEKVRIDFMPIVERTIQPYGVLIDDVHYFSDVLRPWVGVKDPDNPSASRMFLFRRDPRDISQLYFFDPSSERYFAIPYRDVSLPPISFEELKEARKQLKDKGVKNSNEQMIFDIATRQREIVEQSTQKTVAARTQHQKRLNNEKAKKQKARQLPKTTATEKPAEPPVIPGYDPAPNAYFEDEY